MIASGASVDYILAYKNLKYTALHLAAQADLPNMVKVLLNNGADPRIKDVNGKQAFEVATNPQI